MSITTIRFAQRGDQIGVVNTRRIGLHYFQIYQILPTGHTVLEYSEVWTNEAPAVGVWCEWKDTGAVYAG